MNNPYKYTDEKSLFQHIFHQKLYDEIDSKYIIAFSDEYLECKEYYSKYNKNITIEILKSNLKNKHISITAVDNIFNSTDYLKRFQENPKYENDKFIKFKLAEDLSRKVEKDIDNIRSEFVFKKQIEEEFKLLKDETNIETIHLPSFNDNIYDNLPELIKSLTDEFKGTDRDIMLLSQLTTLSTLIPNIKINYAKNIIYPNLLTLILGSSGVGKGIIKYSVKSLFKIRNNEDEMRKRSEKMIEENIEYNKLNSKKPDFLKRSEEDVKIKRTLLSTDTSFSSLFKSLYSNNGEGLLFASELDSMTKNNKTDWGHYSVLLRQGYQNESYSISRLDRVQEIEKLKCSLLASGTPGQLPNYLATKEDGHFGRHIFYYLDNKFKLMNSDDLFGTIDYDDFIENDYSNKVKDFYDFYSSKDYQIIFNKEQIKVWEIHMVNMKNKLLALDDEKSGILVRLGTSGIKMLMVLSSIRYYESDKHLFGENKISVDNRDLKIVINMFQNTLMDHTLSMYDSLEDTIKPFEIKKRSDEEIINKLPDEFTRSNLIELIKKMFDIDGRKKTDILISRLKQSGRIKKKNHTIFIKIK